MSKTTVRLDLLAIPFDGVEILAGADVWQGNPIMLVNIGDAAGSRYEISAVWPSTEVIRILRPPQDANAVSIEFTNDAYDGAPERDRNLHVASIKLGGIPIDLARGVSTNTSDPWVRMEPDGHWAFMNAGIVTWPLTIATNRAPIWNGRPIQFENNIASVVDLRGEASDQDGDQLSFRTVSAGSTALLAANGFIYDPATFSLRFDGRDLGVSLEIPLVIDSGIMIEADDGKQ